MYKSEYFFKQHTMLFISEKFVAKASVTALHVVFLPKTAQGKAEHEAVWTTILSPTTPPVLDKLP